jgi:hypothetical protein
MGCIVCCDSVSLVLVIALVSQTVVLAQDSAHRRSWLDFDGVKMAAGNEKLMASASGGTGQSSLPAQSLNSQRKIKSLHIVPLVGRNAVNLISGQNSAPVVVEIRDDQDLPVEGAKVAFELPSEGPGGSFAGGQKTLATVTNSRGQAMARGFQNNDKAGDFGIQVTAAYQDLTARLEIRQSNAMETTETLASRKRSRKWMWIALAGAAGTGAGLGLHYGLKSSPTYSVGAGPVTIGPPQ